MTKYTNEWTIVLIVKKIVPTINEIQNNQVPNDETIEKTIAPLKNANFCKIQTNLQILKRITV